MLYLLEEEILNIRREELGQLKNMLNRDKRQLESELHSLKVQYERSKFHCSLYSKIKETHFGETMDGFDENFLIPAVNELNEVENNIEDKLKQLNNKIHQTNYIVDHIVGKTAVKE